MEAVRDWVQEFSRWCNNEHRHSKLNFVTSAQRHDGKDTELLRKRKIVLNEAKRLNPWRWSKDVRNCGPIGPITLNSDKKVELLKKEAAILER